MSFPYEPPRIDPLYQSQPTKSYYDASLLATLMLQHGQVLMLAHEQRLRDNYQSIKKQFNQGQLPCHLVYPYKINHSAALIAILHEEGAWANISHVHEMTLAKKLGVAGEKIMITGPVKSDGLLLDAIKMNAFIHLDHLDELSRLAQMTQQMKQTARISLQLTGLNQCQTQFGFTYPHPDFQTALRIIAESDYLQMQGIYHHHHAQNPTGFAQVLDQLCTIAVECRAKGLFPKQLFLGGGFPGSVALKQTQSPEFALASFTHVLKRYEKKLIQCFGSQLAIQVAPGRLLIEDTIDCACKVMGIKPQRQGIDSVFLSAGIHLLPHARYYRHPIRPLSPSSLEANHAYRLCGPSNLHHDIIRQSVQLPLLQVGDTVIIERVGAYHQSHSAYQATAQAAMILLSEHGHHLIQKPQFCEDLLRNELIPAHLRHAYYHLD